MRHYYIPLIALMTMVLSGCSLISTFFDKESDDTDPVMKMYGLSGPVATVTNFATTPQATKDNFSSVPDSGYYPKTGAYDPWISFNAEGRPVGIIHENELLSYYIEAPVILYWEDFELGDDIDSSDPYTTESCGVKMTRDPNGQISRFVTPTFTIDYTYDQDGRLVGKTETNLIDRFSVLSNYTLNSQGLIERYNVATDQGDVMVDERYSDYEFDDHGNWVYRTVTSLNSYTGDNEYFGERRVITYHGGGDGEAADAESADK